MRATRSQECFTKCTDTTFHQDIDSTRLSIRKNSVCGGWQAPLTKSSMERLLTTACLILMKKNKMRDLPKIIDAILAVVPPGHDQLVAGLESLQRSARYAAPELQTGLWCGAVSLLRCHLGCEVPEDGWKLKVHQIMKGEGSNG